MLRVIGSIIIFTVFYGWFLLFFPAHQWTALVFSIVGVVFVNITEYLTRP